MQRKVNTFVVVDAERDGNKPVVSFGRLCIVARTPIGYSESFIQAHVRHLASEIAFAHGQTLPGLTVNDVPVLRQMTPLAGLRYRLRSRLPAGLRAAADQQLDLTVRNIFKQERIDVVLAEYGPTGVMIQQACALAGVPIVVHFHGYDAHLIEVLEENGNYQSLFRAATRIVVVSRLMEKQIAALGCPPHKIVLNPCGVDLMQFTPGRPAASPCHFLAVGRFVDKKAPHLTLAAFAKVVQECPEALLTMAGDGPLLESCRQLARAIGIDGRVAFPGPLPHDEISRRMQSVRAFVQHSLRPSSGDCEGTPVAILEASASALPVVSTRHAGIIEAVKDGETGLLGDEGNIETMARGMIRLARDPNLAESLGLAGRRHIEQHYTLERSIGGLATALAAAVREYRGGAAQ